MDRNMDNLMVVGVCRGSMDSRFTISLRVFRVLRGEASGFRV